MGLEEATSTTTTIGEGAASSAPAGTGVIAGAGGDHGVAGTRSINAPSGRISLDTTERELGCPIKPVLGLALVSPKPSMTTLHNDFKSYS